MLLGIGFKVVLITSVLLGVLVPTRARLLAGRSALPEIEDGPFSSHAVVGLIRPLAQLLDLIVIDARAALPRRRETHIAVAVVFAAPLSAFAVIPFGSRYLLGGSEIDLVVANLDWGILWLSGAAMLSIFGSIALVRDPEKRVPHGVVKISFAVGAGLALAALAMVFGTLCPTAIAVAQDQNFSIGGLFGPALVGFQQLQLPAWGALFQPISLLLYTVCALGMLQTSGADASDEPGSRFTGAQYLLVRTAEHLDHLLVASVVVALFFGGGALPYVSGSSMIEGIGAYFGTGLATLLCMAIHTSVFFVKVVMVVALLGSLDRRIKGLTFATSLNLCWKVVVPLSLLNLFVTAYFLLAVETAQ